MEEIFARQLRDALYSATPPPSPDLADRVLGSLPLTAPMAAAGAAPAAHLAHWLMGLLTATATAAVVAASTLLYLNNEPPDISVFAGYADTGHPGSRLPDPWQGSAGVSFVGSAPNGYDAGAVRIDNHADRELTLDRVTVDAGSHHFDIWAGRRLVVPAHGTLVLTQTGYVQLNPVESNFDTSEVNGDGCRRSDAVAVVHVTVKGKTRDYRDAGRILTTGGVDLGSCQGNANEGHAWEELKGGS
jgi:hypothetical protein